MIFYIINTNVKSINFSSFNSFVIDVVNVDDDVDLDSDRLTNSLLLLLTLIDDDDTIAQ